MGLSTNKRYSESEKDKLRKAIERRRRKKDRLSDVSDDIGAPVVSGNGEERLGVARGHNDISMVAKSRKKVSRKKRVAAKKKISRSLSLSWYEKLAWGFCFFLLCRLLFAERGVLDYRERSKLYSEKQGQLEQIKGTIEQKKRLLKKMGSSQKMHRQMIRENLGFIAEDEYLVLFSKGSQKKADHQ